MQPLFLFSLPRSGSTVLQSVLGAHGEIETVAEPGIWLPLVYALKDRGVYAEYGHRGAAMGLRGLLEVAGAGEEAYIQACQGLVDSICSRAAKRKTARYFLDKTPRYHLIAEKLVEYIREAKFIFLWRNPLGVVASMLHAAPGTRWNLHEYKIDLYQGLDALTQLYARRRNDRRVMALRYEDFVVNPRAVLNRIAVFLELDTGFDNVRGAAIRGAPLGDVRARQGCRCLDSERVHAWRDVLATPVRKWWVKRYLQWIGPERLATMGYKMGLLLEEVEALQVRWARGWADIPRIARGWASSAVELGILRDKVVHRAQWVVHG